MKILNTALGILGSRLLGRPFYARVHVTYRCNYRCRMCGVSDLRPHFDELPLESFKTITERLWKMGARLVVLTGGEPFLRKDLADIVGLFARRGFSVRIQTNGGPQVTRETLSAVARAGARDLSVSVDTLDASLQDVICEGSRVLENALRTLELSLELLPRGISLANIVGSPYNFTELPNLVRYFDARGIYTYITPAVVICSSTDTDDNGFLFRSRDESFDFGKIPQDRRDSIIDELVSLRRHGSRLTNSTRHLEDFRHYLSTGDRTWNCSAGKLTLDVRPDGRASVCKEKHPLGNILDPGFQATHRGSEFRRLAAAQRAACSGCFYGEYREPHYAITDPAVLWEWCLGWLRTFRKGMDWQEGPGTVTGHEPPVKR